MFGNLACPPGATCHPNYFMIGFGVALGVTFVLSLWISRKK